MSGYISPEGEVAGDEGVWKWIRREGKKGLIARKCTKQVNGMDHQVRVCLIGKQMPKFCFM